MMKSISEAGLWKKTWVDRRHREAYEGERNNNKTLRKLKQQVRKGHENSLRHHINPIVATHDFIPWLG